jgi:sec-independent protein translocase protein TatC
MRTSRVNRSLEYGERLSTVGHLEELRSRIILVLIVVADAFGACFWQNERILRLIDAPLARQTQQQVRDGHGPLGATYRVQQTTRDVAYQLRTVVGVLDGGRQRPADRRTLRQVQHSLAGDLHELAAPPQGGRPVTLGIGEPFTTTVTVTLVFALILSLPILLVQAYAFLMPALQFQQRRRMRPLIAAVPALLITGVAFGYFIVLPAAIRFFQNFDSAQFNVLVQASQYYKFAATTLLAMGLLFEVPVAILAVTRAGLILITPRQLRRNRRYAIGLCVLVAAALPGDPITMLLETVPLYLLFELSVLVATVWERQSRTRATPGRPTDGAGESPGRPASVPRR